MIKPYFQDEWQTIYCGDVLEVLPQIERVDMVFADPPFNMSKNYGGNVKGDQMSDADYRKWCARWMELCWNIIVPTGSFYLMTVPKHVEWKMPIMSKYGLMINLIIWRSGNIRLPGRALLGAYQPIMLYGKSGEFITNRQKGESTDFWDIQVITGVQAEAIKAERGSHRKEHPCQMPVEIGERAIKFSTNKDMIVLDPFMGSGTIARAAKRLRRKFIGIDRVERYCEMAVHTCMQETFEIEEVPDKIEQETFL